MSSMLAIHVLAAERGDGLRPELVQALKRQALADRHSFIPIPPGTSSPAIGAASLGVPSERVTPSAVDIAIGARSNIFTESSN